LAEAFRERNSNGKIIEIVPSPDAPIKNQPDAVVVSADEPSKLITTIRDNLREIGKSREDERWKQLCSQAAVERDPDKLMKLLQEINRLLDEKDERRKKMSSTDEPGETS
jgi:predicted metal-dependent RNase